MIMMWEADKMTQVQMPKFACLHISTDCSVKRILVTAHLYCIIHNSAFVYRVLRQVVREVCRYNTFSRPVLAYDRVLEKCFWGLGKSWKSPGNVFNQDSENPDFTKLRKMQSDGWNLHRTE